MDTGRAVHNQVTPNSTRHKQAVQTVFVLSPRRSKRAVERSREELTASSLSATQEHASTADTTEKSLAGASIASFYPAKTSTQLPGEKMRREAASGATAAGKRKHGNNAGKKALSTIYPITVFSDSEDEEDSFVVGGGIDVLRHDRAGHFEGLTHVTRSRNTDSPSSTDIDDIAGAEKTKPKGKQGRKRKSAGQAAELQLTVTKPTKGRKSVTFVEAERGHLQNKRAPPTSPVKSPRSLATQVGMSESVVSSTSRQNPTVVESSRNGNANESASTKQLKSILKEASVITEQEPSIPSPWFVPPDPSRVSRTSPRRKSHLQPPEDSSGVEAGVGERRVVSSRKHLRLSVTPKGQSSNVSSHAAEGSSSNSQSGSPRPDRSSLGSFTNTTHGSGGKDGEEAGPSNAPIPQRKKRRYTRVTVSRAKKPSPKMDTVENTLTDSQDSCSDSGSPRPDRSSLGSFTNTTHGSGGKDGEEAGPSNAPSPQRKKRRYTRVTVSRAKKQSPKVDTVQNTLADSQDSCSDSGSPRLDRSSRGSFTNTTEWNGGNDGEEAGPSIAPSPQRKKRRYTRVTVSRAKKQSPKVDTVENTLADSQDSCADSGNPRPDRSSRGSFTDTTEWNGGNDGEEAGPSNAPSRQRKKRRYGMETVSGANELSPEVDMVENTAAESQDSSSDEDVGGGDGEGLDITYGDGGQKYRRLRVQPKSSHTPGVRRGERTRIPPVRYWDGVAVEYDNTRPSGMYVHVHVYIIHAPYDTFLCEEGGTGISTQMSCLEP